MEKEIPVIKKVSIPKDTLATLPAEEYKGETVLIDSAEMLPGAIASLRGSDVIGFDTETKPSFRKGQSHMVSLLQLSTREKTYLIRLNHTGLTQELIDLLEDAGTVKLGLSVHDDFRNLNKICPIEPKGFLDLQKYVKDFLISDNSLSRIYGILFHKRISKSQRLSNWEAEELTPAQQSYAALDALACIRIHDYLSSGDFVPEKSEYYQEVPIETPEPLQGEVQSGHDETVKPEEIQQSLVGHVDDADGKTKPEKRKRRKKTPEKSEDGCDTVRSRSRHRSRKGEKSTPKAKSGIGKKR